MYDIESIKKYLKNNLSEFRYNHSLKVAEESKKLAICYNYDSEKAYVTGLIHDIAKEFSDEENIKYITKYNLPETLLNPDLNPIIHADIGAVVAKELYHIDDEMYTAIKYHSTGNFPMSILEKIIYVADKIARDTDDPVILKEQKLAYTNLDKTLLMILLDLKQFLEKNGKQMQPITLKLIDNLLN